MSVIRHLAEMLFQGISAYGAAICAAEMHQVSSRERQIRVTAKHIDKTETGTTSLTAPGR